MRKNPQGAVKDSAWGDNKDTRLPKGEVLVPKKLIRGVLVGTTAALASATVLVGVGSGVAHASVQGGCGVNLTSPPPSVNLGADESNASINVFQEKQNLVLPSAVQADVVEGAGSAFPQTYNTAASLPAPSNVAAGTAVDSFYIHTEPVGHPVVGTHFTATIRFDQPILGLFFQWEDNVSVPAKAGPLTLNNTDAVLGAAGVNYNTPPHGGRGMEFPPGGHDDIVTVVNSQTLSLNFVTQTETDDLRVVTQGSPAGSPAAGYRFVASDGGIFGFGNLKQFLGSMGGSPLNKPMVGGAGTCDNGGYWTVASDGGIFSFGDAKFFGSMGNKPLNKPIVTMAGTPDSKGYWMFASDGGVFTFGDAQFHGSTGNIVLNKPVVSASSTPSGNGYWMAATDGGIFSFGDAKFFGSTGNIALNKPVVGMAPTADGQGYWLVASDGGIFTFGDAKFFGSTGSMALNKPIVGMKATPSGKGYWLIASDGGVFTFGDAQFYGSTGNIVLNKPIVGVL
jgi:hypothetical protein